MKIISPFLLWHKIVVLDVRKQIKKIQCMNITIVAAYIVWLYINIKSICLLFTTFLFFPLCFSVFLFASSLAEAEIPPAQQLPAAAVPAWWNHSHPRWCPFRKKMWWKQALIFEKNILQTPTCCYIFQETIIFFFNPLWYDRFRVKSVGRSKDFGGFGSIVSWHLHELRILHDLWT